MNNNEYFLAIDTGGTKCESILLAKDGKVHGFSRFQEKNVSGRSERAIIESVRGAMREKNPGNVYVIGFATKYKPIAENLGFQIFPPNPEHKAQRFIRIIITSEPSAELAIYGLRYGIILLSGTGSFVHGRNRNGEERHLDGFGPVLGDEGAGYYIGLKGLKAAIRSKWSPRRETSLREKVFAHLGISTVDEAVRMSLLPLDRTVFASLSKIVNDEAEKGDMISIGILKEAAAAICDTLSDLIMFLKMTDGKYVMIGAGGVVSSSEIYWNEIVNNVKRMAPNIECRIEKRPPVLGVAVSGMSEILKLGDAGTAELASKITESYYEFIAREDK